MRSCHSPEVRHIGAAGFLAVCFSGKKICHMGKNKLTPRKALEDWYR